MKIAEYEAGGRERYERLAAAVREILMAATAALTDVRVLQIQHRAKDAASLRKKMINRGVSASEELESSIKDLAGCRVILYTNADVGRLLDSQAIHGNFEVDWDRTKFHYPFNENDADQLFVSYNYVLTLDDKHLTEARADLKDLYCEVQVQTILDHAWSEMAHDTIYKRPAAGFGTARLEGTRKRMTEIMSKYLLPAGYDFQKIAVDAAELRAAQELNDRDPLKLLIEANNNRERLGLLQSLEELMLPHYDDLPSLAPRIREVLMSVVAEARTSDAAGSAQSDDEEEDFYRYDTVASVLSKVCGILDDLRFLDESSIVATFDCLIALFGAAEEGDEQKRVLTSAEHLAEHNLRIWQARGPLVQKCLMDRISSLSSHERTTAHLLVVETLENILKPDFSSTTSSFDTVTFHTGAIAPSATLEATRQAATDVLEQMFDAAASDEDRVRLLGALHAATRVASQGDTKPKMYAIILRATDRFVRFITERWTSLSFEVRQKAEHKVLWLHKHRATVGRFRRNKEVKRALAGLDAAIGTFRSITDLEPDYVVFKTLVGFDEVLAPYWRGSPHDKTFREAEVSRLANSIDSSSLAHWRAQIERCAASQSADGAYYIYFSGLLREFAQHQPDLAITLLEPPIGHLDAFLDDLLNGFDTGPRQADVMRLVDGWVAQGQYLSAIARYLWRAKSFDKARLVRTFDAASKIPDRFAIHTSLKSAGEHVQDDPDLLQTVILPAISRLGDLDVPRWVEAVAFSKGGMKALEAVSDAEADVVFAALLQSPDMSHWTEEVLAHLAPRFPVKFVSFMGQRLEIEANNSRGQRYEAIPFECQVLPDHMSVVAGPIILAARGWFGSGGDAFRFRGGAVVARLFPEPKEIEPLLAAYISGGDRSDIDFVINILMSYSDGASATSALCRDIVEALPAHDDLLRELSIVIEQSGVLTGEFGGVGVKQGKRDYMKTWLADKREKVRKFAEGQIRDLERSMAADQRRSMEQLQLRKRAWGAA